MNGYVAFNADNKEYARIKFTSPETVRNVTVYTQSNGGRRPSNTNKTIKFDSDGGSNIPNQTIASGNTASVPPLTKEGFTFECWYTDENYQNKLTEESVIENGNIYGKWINNRTPELLNATDHIAYINGYPDKTVRPENNITREEVAVILSGLYADIDATYVANFKDINGHWAENDIKRLSAIECISGYDDGTFKPEQRQ